MIRIVCCKAELGARGMVGVIRFERKTERGKTEKDRKRPRKTGKDHGRPEKTENKTVYDREYNREYDNE